MELYIQQESLKPITLYSSLQPVLEGADRRRVAVLQDPGSAPPTISRRRPSCARRPASTTPTSSTISSRWRSATTARRRRKSHGFQAHVGPMRSKSRGSVTLRIADPKAKPVIRFNYMSHPDDWSEFRHCHPADPRDLRPAGVRSLSRPRDPAGRRSSRATTSSTPSSATMPRAPTIPAAPAAWVAPTIRWRSSIRNAG